MFFSNDTYLFGTNSNSFIISFSRYMLIGICLLLLLRLDFKLAIGINKGKTIAYLTIISLYVILAFINNELFNRIIIKLLCMTVAYLLCMLLSFDDFYEAFGKAVFFIASCAIVFTTLAYIFPSVVRMFPAVINTANVKIFTCLFAGLDERMIGSIAVRTSGIYWEPGVFQMYLNLVIAYELFYKKELNKKVIIIDLIALILTFSTTGYAVFAWILICYGFLKKSDRNGDFSTRFAVVSLVFICGVFVLLFTSIGDVVLGKVVNPAASGTAEVRLAGVVSNIEIALDNPWHGIGMETMNETFLRYSMKSNLLLGWTEQNTNTLLYQFAAHGIFYGIIFAIGTFKFGNNFDKGRKTITCVIFIMMILMYVGENLQYSWLPYIIIFYGYGWKEEILRTNQGLLGEENENLR